MSVHAISWAYKQRCYSTGAKFLLVTMANYCDENGCCWPSIKTLAAETQMTAKHISTLIEKLEEAGQILKEGRPGRGHGRQPNLYILRMQSELSTHCPQNVLSTEGAERTEYVGQNVLSSAQNVLSTYDPKENRQNEPSDTRVRAREKPKPPSDVDPGLWDDFLKLRTKLKAPNSDRAMKLLSMEMERVHRETGESFQSMIERSLINGWKSVYPRNASAKPARKRNPL